MAGRWVGTGGLILNVMFVHPKHSVCLAFGRNHGTATEFPVWAVMRRAENSWEPAGLGVAGGLRGGRSEGPLGPSA